MTDTKLDDLAQAHRVSIWAVIAGFLGACTHIYAALAAIPFHMYGAFRVGRCLRVPIVALVAIEIVMLVPVANTLALLLLNNRAGRVLKQAGLSVGPMGVSKDSAERFNQSEAMLKAIEASSPSASSATDVQSQR
ncbi:MAG: hypothetical protein IPJ50_00175 [Betaproteobacteria bacterium]|nr:hypothetical protein [Betaproteobacteria bacterium]